MQLRAESPHGHYNSPLLGLVSGTYPAGPGQVALTSQVAARYGAHVGGTWHAAGTTWRVTGIVQDPSNLADEFALVAPGQIRHPSQVIMLLGPAAAQELVSDQTVPGVPAATVSVPTQQVSGVSPAVLILVVEVLGLAFIGLVSVASFSVMAQRRLRALGMLGAIGATERNLRLVMIAGGLVVGVVAALAGAVLGLAAWIAYVPTVQRDTGHAVDAANLPWWAFGHRDRARDRDVGAGIPPSGQDDGRGPGGDRAVRPPRAAQGGAPLRPARRHRVRGRPRVPGVRRRPEWSGRRQRAGGQGHALFLLGGLVITIIGICLLAPLAISVLAAGAGPRLPVAIRIALRDLVRYRARSGAALAATTFAVFLAMGICVVASIKFDNPLNWIGPNLSSSQVTVGAAQSPGPGQMDAVQRAQLASLTTRVNTLAASLHASAVPLESAATLYQVGTPAHGPQNFTGIRLRGHPAVARHVRDQGQPDRSRHRHPHHAARAGGPAAPGDDLAHRRGPATITIHLRQRPQPGADGGPPCTLSNDCLASPAIADGQQPAQRHVGAEHGDHRVRGEQVPPADSAVRVADPGTCPAHRRADQRRAAIRARQRGAGPDRTRNPSLGDFTDGATALGIVIALSVLAMSVGLIRSETAPDLRTLTATGASGATRRTITAATAAALGLLGAILGMAGAVIAGMAWAHSSLTAMFGDVPLSDVLILLIGLPLVAAIGGWLFAGREPPAVARQPIE